MQCAFKRANKLIKFNRNHQNHIILLRLIHLLRLYYPLTRLYPEHQSKIRAKEHEYTKFRFMFMFIQSAFDLFAHMRAILTWKMKIQLKF